MDDHHPVVLFILNDKDYLDNCNSNEEETSSAGKR